jgi:hypothetical protein
LAECALSNAAAAGAALQGQLVNAWKRERFRYQEVEVIREVQKKKKKKKKKGNSIRVISEESERAREGWTEINIFDFCKRLLQQCICKDRIFVF